MGGGWLLRVHVCKVTSSKFLGSIQIDLLCPWLLRGLSRLMIVVVMMIIAWRHVTCCLRSWRDVRLLSIASSWAAWRHTLLLVSIWRNSIHHSTHVDLLRVIQKIWKGRFLSWLLISCFRDVWWTVTLYPASRLMMSRGSRMASLLLSARFLCAVLTTQRLCWWLWNLICYPFLALPKRRRSLRYGSGSVTCRDVHSLFGICNVWWLLLSRLLEESVSLAWVPFSGLWSQLVGIKLWLLFWAPYLLCLIKLLRWCLLSWRHRVVIDCSFILTIIILLVLKHDWLLMLGSLESIRRLLRMRWDTKVFHICIFMKTCSALICESLFKLLAHYGIVFSSTIGTFISLIRCRSRNIWTWNFRLLLSLLVCSVWSSWHSHWVISLVCWMKKDLLSSRINLIGISDNFSNDLSYIRFIS